MSAVAVERARRLEATKLVGREQELRTARAALRTTPALLLVVGEAGVGKTRLVAELARDHGGSPWGGAEVTLGGAAHALAGRAHDGQPVRWLTARCRPIQNPTPLAPLAEAFRGTAGLSDCFDDAGPATGRYSAWSGLLESLAELGPTVLVIEDLHWADRGTMQVLQFLTARLPPEFQLIGTYRPEESREITTLAGAVPPGTRVVEVRLQPLGAAAVHELAAEVLGMSLLPSALTGELLDRAGGLPFVIEELLRAVVDRGSLESDAMTRAMAAAPAPLALRASVMLRLEHLPDVCRRVVCAAAVLNSPAPDSLLGAIAEASGTQLAEAIDGGLARGLLRQKRPGLYDVRHALAQRAVYETIPLDELRRLHRRSAVALAAVEPPPHARIADHFRSGGLIADWMIHAEAAVDQLIVAQDNGAAVEQLTAMVRMEALPWADRARLAVKLGAAVSPEQRWQDAVILMSTILAESTAPTSQRGRLRLALGLLLHQRAGEVLAGRREVAAAVVELDLDPASAAWALSALAPPVFGTEDIAEHRSRLDDAVRLLNDRQPYQDEDAKHAVRVNRARFQLATGVTDGVEEVGAEAADGLAWLGHDSRSTALLERAAAGWDRFSAAAGAGTRMRLAFGAAEWGGLAERLSRARADAAGMPLVRMEIDLVDGRYQLARGEVAEGKQLLESVLGATGSGPLTIRVAAVAALARQGLVGPCMVEECVAMVRRKEGWAWAGDLMIAACSVLDRLTAEGLAIEFAEGLIGRDAPAARAALTMVRAGLEGSAELFGQAAAEYEALGRKYDQYGALEGRGMCLLAAGESEELVAIATAYEVLGARGDARRCRDALREAGVMVSPRRGRRGYGNALSPRELEVARLAAKGLSNSSIATALSLSVSTVEDHLSRAMRKLDVRSRHALAPLVTR